MAGRLAEQHAARSLRGLGLLAEVSARETGAPVAEVSCIVCGHHPQCCASPLLLLLKVPLTCHDQYIHTTCTAVFRELTRLGGGS